MADLTQDQWREKLENDDKAVILDVRTDIEVQEECIPGSIQMNIQNTAVFYEDAKKLDPSKDYFVYCRSGARSAQACMLFNSLGIKNAYNLIGGIMEWEGEKTTNNE